MTLYQIVRRLGQPVYADRALFSLAPLTEPFYDCADDCILPPFHTSISDPVSPSLVYLIRGWSRVIVPLHGAERRTAREKWLEALRSLLSQSNEDVEHLRRTNGDTLQPLAFNEVSFQHCSGQDLLTVILEYR